MYIKYIKRAIDILLALLAIVMLSLPMFALALAIKIDSPGPVFFKQKRIGIHKSTFFIIKFRSMPISTPSDVPTHQLHKDQVQLSGLQRAMRRSSLDELPQLFNILGGSMSFVGPRPALWNQYDLIAERDRYGANVLRPGLTGWAQINGRDELEIAEKARLDGEYAEKASFLFDLKCFVCTFTSVLRADGVREGGTAAAEKEVEREKTVV